MAWRTIAATETDPGAPFTSELAKAYADNPGGIAEGATGAPRIAAAALQTGTPERDWVLARTAAASVGAVGTYAMLRKTTSTGASPGTTDSGSILDYASAGGIGSASSPSGTWRAMGAATGDTGSLQERTTLWLRIS